MIEDKENHWTLYAECRGKWDLFDSVDVDGKDTYPHEAKAKAICATCPVKRECDAAGGNALTNIWAGKERGK